MTTGSTFAKGKSGLAFFPEHHKAGLVGPALSYVELNRQILFRPPTQNVKISGLSRPKLNLKFRRISFQKFRRRVTVPPSHITIARFSSSC